MSGPAYAVVGDQDLPTELPETRIPQEILVEEKKMAKYSRTAEFKRLKEYIEERIEFHQKFLPDGSTVYATNLNNTDLAARWIGANIVIAELKSILSSYDQAAESVKSVDEQR